MIIASFGVYTSHQKNTLFHASRHFEETHAVFYDPLRCDRIGNIFFLFFETQAVTCYVRNFDMSIYGGFWVKNDTFVFIVLPTLFP